MDEGPFTFHPPSSIPNVLNPIHGIEVEPFLPECDNWIPTDGLILDEKWCLVVFAEWIKSTILFKPGICSSL